MTIRWTLRRWSSPADACQQAAELLPAPADADALQIALVRVARDLNGAAFLLVRIDGIEPAAVCRASDAFIRAGGAARLCLAGSRTSLTRLAAAEFDCDRAGLLLDDVDAATPPVDLIWDRLEAIRFSADFVAAAARNLRLGCVLESMLGLARDLGLCTLGAETMPGGGSLVGRGDFDYLPTAPDGPAAVSKRARVLNAMAAPALNR